MNVSYLVMNFWLEGHQLRNKMSERWLSYNQIGGLEFLSFKV